MKPYISIILVSIISSVCVQTLHAQSKFEDYFIKGGVSYDARTITDKIFPPFDPETYLMGFWSKGIEIGKRTERKIISMHFQFGENINKPDITIENGLDNEFEVERYMQLAGAFRWQFNKYKNTDSQLLFNIGVRNMAGVSYFHGVQLINAYSNNPQLIDYDQATIDFETGIYLEVGRYAGNKPGFFINFEPFYIMVTNQGLGGGILKLSGMIQF
jgi:hypothetical protein